MYVDVRNGTYATRRTRRRRKATYVYDDEDDSVYGNEDRAERTVKRDEEHSQQPLVFE